MAATKFRVIRPVTYRECSWLDRDFFMGEILYEYLGYTYGWISTYGLAVCEDSSGEGPFFDFPSDALEIVS